MERDDYTRLRLLISDLQADIKTTLAQVASELRAEIREVAARVEHYERTSEMRFKGMQEAQGRVQTDIGDLRSTMREHDRRLHDLEKVDASSTLADHRSRLTVLERHDATNDGKEQGGSQTRANITWVLGLIVALVTLYGAYAIGQGGT